MNLICPTCSKEIHVERKEEAAFRPFCSRRCKLVDLGRWLDGTYSITEPLPESPDQVLPLPNSIPPDRDSDR